MTRATEIAKRSKGRNLDYAIMIIPTETTPMPIREEEKSIDLRRYLALFLQWWWIILLATLLMAAVGFVISSQMTPVYEASTTIFIREGGADTSNELTNITISERLARSYAQMLTKRPVFEKVIARLGIALTADELSEMVTASTVRDTQLIIITVEASDPNLAATIANAFVLVFSEQIQDTQSLRYGSSLDGLKTQITETENQIATLKQSLTVATETADIARLETRLNQYHEIYTDLVLSYENVRAADAHSVSSVVQVEQAIPPSTPIRPNTAQNILLAAVVGLMLSMGTIFAADFFDDTVKSPDEITRRLRLPIMGTISRHVVSKENPLITRTQPRSPAAESFRALRTNVQYASVDRPLRTLMITSPAPSDGKTTVTANLATVLAQGGLRVTVVDADLHRPRVHRVFKVDPRPGFSSLFIKPTIRLNGSFQPTGTDRLHVIASGDLPPNPSELLGSKKMRDILATVLDQSDMVFFDSPPVLSVSDAVVLAPIVDGVLVVVRPGVTKMSALKAAVDQLRYVGANVIGIVLNGVDEKSSRYGYYYKPYTYKPYKYRTSSKAPQPPTRPPQSFTQPTPEPELNLH